MTNTVLIAEDNEMNRHLLVQQLKRLEITDVVLVEDGLKALEWLEGNECAVLLADCLMPNMGGYELARNVRQREMGTDKHLHIIAISACVTEDDKKSCYEAGIDEHISKPIQLAQLYEVLSPWVKAVFQKIG